MSDENGNLAPGSVARYYPFGDWRTEPATNPAITDRGFTGHKHNNSGASDLGLIYMNARYYVSGIARFASADTIVPNPTNPQSFNRYSYVNNRPINFIDPTGHMLDPGRENDGGGQKKKDPLTPFWEEPKDPLLDQLDKHWRSTCISQGESCLANRKFRFFGIPSTTQQWNTLIAQEAHNLCYDGGACAIKQTTIMFSAMFVPWAAVNTSIVYAAYALTGYEVGDALLHNDWKSAGQEVALEAGGEMADAIPNMAPMGGVAFGAIDIAIDIGNLSDLEQEYIGQARKKVELQVAQSETTFMNAHLASHGIFPWNPANPFIVEHQAPLVLAP